MPSQPFVSNPALRFRGIEDSLAATHLEGSECCLIHIDNPLSTKHGVYMNPNVRVSYSNEAQKFVRESFPSPWSVFKALWENRLRRWMTTTWLKEMHVRSSISRWRKENSDLQERGDICLVNEMQILVENGWAHVK